LKSSLESLLNSQVLLLPSKKPAAAKGPNSIRLDKGELPFAPSPLVIEALKKEISQINRYPELLGESLRKALAQYTQAKVEQIILGNGSDDLIELILKVFVAPGDEVILPSPTFFIYEFATKVVGGIPINVARNKQFDIEIEDILARLNSKTKIIFLANPNNPTANLTSREKIIELLEKSDCLVVVDECYYEIAGLSVIDLIESYPNLLVLRSFSKSFGLAGIRLGYALASSQIIDYLYRLAQLFPVNRLALVAGEAALGDLGYIEENIKKIIQQRVLLQQGLEALGLQVYPSATNFLFARTTGITSAELVESLAQQEIYLADFGLKQGLDAYYLRIAVGSERENELLLQAISEKITGDIIK